jgi:hypothetical protein
LQQRGHAAVDRFLIAGGSALDLATGQPVRIRRLPAPSATALFTRRGSSCLIDAAPQSSRTYIEAWERWGEAPIADPMPIAGVLAARADARDGHPRAVDVTAGDGDQWRRAARDIARAGRQAGFVPIADVMGELLRAGRWQWPRWLADRALVVLTCDGYLSAPATLALLRLASRDSRPHLVIRGATSVLQRPTRLVRLSSAVHEDPGGAAEDACSPELLAERAWRAAEQGGNGHESDAAARWAVMLAPTAETEARGRAALAQTLITQGRTLEARAALAPGVVALAHLSTAAAVTVRKVQDGLRAADEPRRGDRGRTDDFLRVLEVCQGIEDEVTALGGSWFCYAIVSARAPWRSWCRNPDGAARCVIWGRGTRRCGQPNGPWQAASLPSPTKPPWAAKARGPSDTAARSSARSGVAGPAGCPCCPPTRMR